MLIRENVALKSMNLFEYSSFGFFVLYILQKVNINIVICSISINKQNIFLSLKETVLSRKKVIIRVWISEYVKLR